MPRVPDGGRKDRELVRFVGIDTLHALLKVDTRQVQAGELEIEHIDVSGLSEVGT